jgi:hypothetical protein
MHRLNFQLLIKKKPQQGNVVFVIATSALMISRKWGGSAKQVDAISKGTNSLAKF